MTTHARSWACRCGAHLMLTFDSVPGKAGEPGVQFACPGCGVKRTVPSAAGAHVTVDSVRVRRV